MTRLIPDDVPLARSAAPYPFPLKTVARVGVLSLLPRVATVVRDGRDLLMVQLGRGRHLHRWDLPGGKLEPGESLRNGAARETLEETGYRVLPHSLCGRYRYRNASGDMRERAVFFADIVGGAMSIDGQEILEARWFSLDELAAMRDERLRRPELMRRILADVALNTHLPLHHYHELPTTAVALAG